jgi:signal transduction histidine kinase
VPAVFALATLGMVVAMWGATEVDGQVVGGPDDRWANLLATAGLAAIAASLVLAAGSLVVKHRRGGQRTRRQIRWLLLATILVVALLVAGWFAEALGASLDVAYSPFLLAIVTLVPTAVGVAMVRHDLFDVDRLLSTTTAWLVTVVVSAAVFGVVVYVVGTAVVLSTGASSTIAAFVTALTILPLQHHLAAGVGRLVDRDRYVAIATVERYAADVRSGRRQPEEIEAVLRAVQDDPQLVLYLARPDGGWVRSNGTPAPEARGFPIDAGGDIVARVSLGWDSARARRRLADLAKAAWVPIEVSRLRLVLREALAEAESSRERLVVATADERRRLERDLHDGAQQRIVATGMRLRLLQERLSPADAAEVDAVVDELRDTVDELRRIAHGVRPSQLDDGLAAALAAVKRASPLPIELDVTDLPDVSDTRALTAYLVVSEAVVNVLKHAQASRIRVVVVPLRDRLAVEVTDDGVGGVPVDAPLRGLRDRVVSVGGTVDVESAVGAGTTIRVVI